MFEIVKLSELLKYMAESSYLNITGNKILTMSMDVIHHLVPIVAYQSKLFLPSIS